MLMPMMPLKVIPVLFSLLSEGIRTFILLLLLLGKKKWYQMERNGWDADANALLSHRLVDNRVIFLLSNAAANSYTHTFMGAGHLIHRCVCLHQHQQEQREKLLVQQAGCSRHQMCKPLCQNN